MALNITEEELQAMLDAAARRGAEAVLKELGIDDAPDAGRDFRDLRSLLESWRQTRSTIWRQIISVLTAAILGYIAISVWSNLRVSINN